MTMNEIPELRYVANNFVNFNFSNYFLICWMIDVLNLGYIDKMLLDNLVNHPKLIDIIIQCDEIIIYFVLVLHVILRII